MSRPDDRTESQRGGKVFDRLALVAFCLLAFLRIVYGSQALEHSPVLLQPLADSVVYVEEARRIGAGQVLAEQPFYRAPLYPYVIAPFFAASDRPEQAVLVLQIGLGLGILLLSWSIARRLFGPAAALTSLALLGLFGPLAGFETKILGTTLGIFLGMLGLRLLVTAERSWRFLVGGMTIGVACLARPGLLLFGIVAALLYLIRDRRPQRHNRRKVALLAVGMILGVAPATIHNLQAGDFVLISSNGGLTFYDGNHRDNETGLYEPGRLTGFRGNAVNQARADLRRASEISGRELKPSEASRFWFRRGLEDLAADPAHTGRLYLKKIVRFFGVSEIPDNYSHLVETTQVPALRLFLVPFPLLLILAIVAWVIRGFRRRDEILVLAFAGIGFLTCLLFFVNSRYRCEAVPALAILAGTLVVDFPRVARRRRLLAMGVAIPLLGLALAPGGVGISKRESTAAAQWAGALEIEGRIAEARSLYRAATGLDPRNAPAWGKRARLTMEIDGLDAGVAILDAAIASGADGPLVRLERGTALITQGRLEEAEADLRRANRSDRSDPSIALNLSACLVKRGADQEAEGLLSNPGLDHDPIALYYRGLVALRAGRHSDAAAHLDRSIAAGATDVRPQFLRAIAWLRIGEDEKAATWLAAWVESRGFALTKSEADRLLGLLSGDPLAGRFDLELEDPAAEETIRTILEKVWMLTDPIGSS